MRLGTTIAAVVLVGSLTSSTAEMSALSSTPESPPPAALGPPPLAPQVPVAVAPAATSIPSPSTTATAGRGGSAATSDRPTTARTVPGDATAPTWSVNLSAGEGAGVAMVSGAVRLDRAGVFLAPLEDAGGSGAASTGSTGADAGTAAVADHAAGRASTEGAPDLAATGTPVPTGLLTLPIRRLNGATVRVDSMVLGLIPAGSTATVDVRGRDADGNWSEWTPTGSAGSTVTLPRPAVAVQGRLVLTGPPTDLTGDLTGPAVRGVTMTVHPLALPGVARPAPPTIPAAAASPTPPTSTSIPTSSPAAKALPTTTTPSTTGTPAPTPPTGARSTPDTEEEDDDDSSTSRSTSSKSKSSTSKPTTTTAKPTTSDSDDSSDDDDSSDSSDKSDSPGLSSSAKSTGNALKYRVFATREGLVGRTTANGHKIKSSDRFVALPSRRALSPNGSADYSVKVCASNGRCAVAPVWDVGPWNTRDDYWNPKSRRQEWRDLPQGMPEAQAAKERGYNKGLDQFKRKVANPAGIDLSDGLFWGALGLKDNGWVTVEYLWTGAGKD
jgi:hypothetical protein